MFYWHGNWLLGPITALDSDGKRQTDSLGLI
jgi:hypothetical protein